MILLAETGKDDMKSGKDHILEMLWCKSHHISIRVLLPLVKNFMTRCAKLGLMVGEENENACIRSQYL